MPILHRCKELVPILCNPPPPKKKTQVTAVLFTSEIITEFFTCIRNWCRFFTGVRNWYKFFAPPPKKKKKKKKNTQKNNSSQLFFSRQKLSLNSSFVLGLWCQFLTGIRNWYQFFATPPKKKNKKKQTNKQKNRSQPFFSRQKLSLNSSLVLGISANSSHV